MKVPGPFPKMILYFADKEKTTPVAIQCLACGLKSWNEKDVKNIYCVNCHRFGSLVE